MWKKTVLFFEGLLSMIGNIFKKRPKQIPVIHAVICREKSVVLVSPYERTIRKMNSKSNKNLFYYLLSFSGGIKGKRLDIHTRTFLPDVPFGTVGHSLKTLKEFQKDLDVLYLRLSDIKGLESAWNCGGGYTLSVFRAELFVWKELIPQILTVMSQTVGKGKKFCEVRYK